MVAKIVEKSNKVLIRNKIFSSGVLLVCFLTCFFCVFGLVLIRILTIFALDLISFSKFN